MAGALPNNLDSLLARMIPVESSGNANARGKAGEIGLFQIKPETAHMYGIDPRLLTNPTVNRYVARRYLGDLMKRFGGDPRKALEAYNEGPTKVAKGDIVPSAKDYASKILGKSGSGDKAAPSISFPLPQGIKTFGMMPTSPEGNTLEIPSRVAAKPAADSGPMALLNRALSALGPASASAEEFTGDPSKLAAPKKGEAFTGDPTKLAPVPSASPTPKPEPLGARIAGYAPMVGQFAGEGLGGLAGAAVPGAGETGASEFVGATAGGALGSAGGAEVENAVRRAYGLPPVSVGKEAAFGGLTSGGGQVLSRLTPFLGRFLKAGRIAKATGIGFKDALEKVTQMEAELGGKLGMNARVADLVKDAPGGAGKAAYLEAKHLSERELGEEYDKVLKPFRYKMTPNTARRVADRVSRRLELAGKPLREAIDDELNAQPMTVQRARIILSELRSYRRGLNPDTQGVARDALKSIQDALKSDIRQTAGSSASHQLDVLDTYYRQLNERMPERSVLKSYTVTDVAKAITEGQETNLGRRLEVLDEMDKRGQLLPIRKAVAARIFQRAGADEALAPAERFASIKKSVEAVDPQIFDRLYGKGARKEWLAAADSMSKLETDLLKNPTEAKAVHQAVREYLEKPGMVARLGNRLGHRIIFDLLVFGGGYESGHLAAAGAGVAGLELYEAAAHSRPAMWALQKAATSKTAQETARWLIAATTASTNELIQSKIEDGRAK